MGGSASSGLEGKEKSDGIPNGGSRWTKPREGGEGKWRRLDQSGEQAADAAAAGGDAAAAAMERQRAEEAARECAEVDRKIREAAARRSEEEAEERRRLAQALTPEQRAQAEALHAQQTAAASAQFGSAQASEVARQVHVGRVMEIVKAAREKDLQFDQAELMGYTSEQLEDWARRHI